MTKLASAPGKLIALGEYAVLEGASALVFAVDCEAIAYIAKGDAPPLSPFLAAAEERCALELGPEPRRIRVDTSAFRTGDRKLGLGSSAAATVAYVAARFELAGELESDRVHAVAHAAHGEVSARGGARGSGADIAASVWGGPIMVTPATRKGDVPTVTRLPLAALQWVVVDSGRSANTRELVSAVRGLEERNNDLYWELLDEISAACVEGCRALDDAFLPNVERLCSSFERGLVAIDALGRACGLELVTESHRKIAEIAKKYGGAAKSTGAGGGDAALAVFASEADAERFCGDLRASGIQRLHFDVIPTGIRVFG